MAGHIVCKFFNMVDGLGPHFLLTYTMVPSVAAPQDFLKVLLECEFRVESDT